MRRKWQRLRADNTDLGFRCTLPNHITYVHLKDFGWRSSRCPFRSPCGGAVVERAKALVLPRQPLMVPGAEAMDLKFLLHFLSWALGV